MQNDHTYLIGEIGQNHNGSVEIAKQLVDKAATPVLDKLFNVQLAPMDAIKLTKRDLNEELTDSEMSRPYNSPHAFGKTYGEHRQFLELDDLQHLDIQQYAKSKGLQVVETLCAKGCLTLLNHFLPDRLKVASRDLTNLPLLESMAETGIPMILSTGMSGREELDQALDTITRYHEKVSILHCLSQYPAEYKNINLRAITYLQENYSKYTIGYSDHSIGISIPVAAVAMGAKVVEKHITLDRNMKGTDQKGSLGPDGIFRMVRDIRNLERALGVGTMDKNEAVFTAKTKLERSIASKHEIKAGSLITEQDVHLLSPGTGFRWADRQKVLGKKATRDIPANEIIQQNFLL